MEGSKSDFKWFGEGFDGFPRFLPEDCVEYTFYIIDPKLEESEIRAQLRAVQLTANDLVKKLLKNFIWQRQSFKLELIQDKGSSFLRGRTDYGDSVEDEWLIVYILRELSKQHPQIWGRIVDTDGEFLLIEAANVLPRWLNPEVADFRLWLNEGKLLIIPRQNAVKKHVSGKPCPPAITLQDAFIFIREDRQNFLHSPLIEAEALYRLQRYPKQIEESMHRSLTTIPRKLAYILHKKASYISPAVEAFYLRDPISLRLLQVHDEQMLIFPPDDLVTVSIKYTKVGYAQMRSQQFTAPLAWVSHLSAESDAKKFGRIEMGMKVTSGFEMLLSDPCNIDNATVREIQMLLEDLKADEDHLPSDFDIQGWGHKDDNEGWLDINFRDFENEISRKGETGSKRTAEGFGDKNTQETLRKMVSRFEDFLNDDKAGVDGAESSNFSDDMDHNNDDGDDDDSNSTSNDTNNDSEDQEVSFDEDQFTKSMREMMGMPADTATQADAVRGGNMNSINENDEGIEIYQDMQAMEAELKDAGALHTYSKPNSNKKANHKPSPIFKTQSHGSPSLSSVGVSDTEDVDIDFNLVENLMESFKSQNGAAGPGGNLMGLMGTRLPRDDGEYS